MGTVNHGRFQLDVLLFVVALPPLGGVAADDDEIGFYERGGDAGAVDELLKVAQVGQLAADLVNVLHRGGPGHCIDQLMATGRCHSQAPLAL